MNTFVEHLVPWLFVLAAIAVIVSPFAWSRLVAWRERRRDAKVQQRQRQYKDEGYARELRRGLPVTDATLEATREKLRTFKPDTRPARRPVPQRLRC
jgi:Flp pilus assembly protein TadB